IDHLEYALIVDVKVADNNAKHHTDQMSTTQLIMRRGQSFSFRLKFKEPFNPGVHNLLFTATLDDSVYMENEKKIQEYVLTNVESFHRQRQLHLPHMDFVLQFEDDMVEIALTLLYVSPEHFADPLKDEAARCDPIYVSRVISRMINSNGDRGVLEGRWERPYIGGMSPSHWSGSYPILKRWYNSGCQPVKFGQCWVFAGVMCSVMRALGIPCRVITNYESAHDCDKNLTIDVYHADLGVKEIPSPDSIWNFHVWFVDPTPQELSGGAYQCGPAPVKAILNGNTDLDYDVPFVFAEVNADCIDYLKTISTDSRRVGQNISTKSVGSNKRWTSPPITSTKKYDSFYVMDFCTVLQVLGEAFVYRPVFVEMSFTNPVSETLRDCSITLSGSGLTKEEEEEIRFRVKVSFYPHKAGKKTLMANFNCSVFKNIKKSIPIIVQK
uniref:Transglutaminase-like domain-containing protein n=1 Tax=Neogobius melanostomus TaxID=47308 RepID=A0A8C6WMB2_9GOBI